MEIERGAAFRFDRLAADLRVLEQLRLRGSRLGVVVKLGVAGPVLVLRTQRVDQWHVPWPFRRELIEPSERSLGGEDARV